MTGSWREATPPSVVYTGGDEIAAKPHAGNAVGDKDRPPRVVVDVPGASIVLSADEADALARQLHDEAGRARRVYGRARAAGEDAPAEDDAEVDAILALLAPVGSLHRMGEDRPGPLMCCCDTNPGECPDHEEETRRKGTA